MPPWARTLVRVSAKTKTLVGAVAVTAIGVGIGVTLHSPNGGDEPAATSESTASTESLSDVDTTTLVVRREAFCDRVDSADVEAALGSKATRASSYGDGDSAKLTDSVKDVAQEYGCTWSGARGAQARAWVFAPPVTHPWARHMAHTVPKGCRPERDLPYGSPSVAFSCGATRSTVSVRGLFGDAWLSCELTGRRSEPSATVSSRAGSWCLAVARAAG